MEENKPFAGRVFGITGNLDRDAIIAQIKAAGGTVRSLLAH
jgi:NAD-dependent DNA ligase